MNICFKFDRKLPAGRIAFALISTNKLEANSNNDHRHFDLKLVSKTGTSGKTNLKTARKLKVNTSIQTNVDTTIKTNVNTILKTNKNATMR